MDRLFAQSGCSGGGEEAFAFGADVGDYVEGVRVEGGDEVDYAALGFPTDDGFDDRDFGNGAFTADMGRAEAVRVQLVDQRGAALLGVNANEEVAEGDLVFDQYADEVARRVAAGVSQVGGEVVGVRKDLRDDHDPNEDLEKSNDGRLHLLALRYENDAQRAQRHVADTPEEDHERQCPGVGL